jgi:hypothetical protein
MPRTAGRINRFVVMAMLQAARAHELGLPVDASYSWGLNRAIFYAAAKRGFRRGTGSSEGSTTAPRPEVDREIYRLGDEEAYRDVKSKPLRFTIGDTDQTPEEFKRQIAARFGSKENFETAWEEAMHVVASVDRTVLASRRQFFDEVYRPRRDVLSGAWAERFGPPAAPA